MDELGIKDIAATIKHIETQHASSKTKNSGTKKSHGEGSDTSEFLPEDDEQGVQCDDDSYLEPEQPIPIMIEVLLLSWLWGGARISAIIFPHLICAAFDYFFNDCC